MNGGERSLCICLLTYNRFEYAVRTVLSTLDNIRTELDIHLHIADDGSPSGYIEALMHEVERRHTLPISVSNTGHHSYGRNYNLATQVTHQHDYILPLEDDWELTRVLDIDPLLEYFDKPLHHWEQHPHDRIGCIRLGYLSGTGTIRGTYIPEGILLLDEHSNEQHIFTGHPRLVTPEWERMVGPWPEGLSPGDTELAVCGNVYSRRGVVWPMNLIKSYGDLFVHIGTVPSTEVSTTEVAHV